LQKYCDITFDIKEFKPVTNPPTPKVLKEFGIEISNKEDNYKQKRLDAYNNIKQKQFEKDQKNKLLNHRKDFVKKYMQNKDMWEFDTLSMFITNNPFKNANKIIQDFDEMKNNDPVVIVGTIIEIDRRSKDGKQYAFVNLYNGNKTIELILWNKQYNTYQNFIEKGRNIVVLGKKKDSKIFVEKIKDFYLWKKEKGI